MTIDTGQQLPIARPGWIVIHGATQHNLRSLDLAIPRDQLSVITGVSGSGKSSLAFDTMYAEGYRQYLDSLSPYTRRTMPRVAKPQVESITGLTPTIAIEQRKLGRNPRSNVGTITEVSDYLRLLFSRLGRHSCTDCSGVEIYPLTLSDHLDWLDQHNDRFHVLTSRQRDDDAQPQSDDDDQPQSDDDDEQHFILRPGRRSTDSPDLENFLTEQFRNESSVEVSDGTQVVRYLSSGWVCVHCGRESKATTSDWFSQNTPRGMCEPCEGLGYTLELEPDSLVFDRNLSILDGALSFYGDRRNIKPKKTWWPIKGLEDLLTAGGFTVGDTAWKELPTSVTHLLLIGEIAPDLPDAMAEQFSASPSEGLVDAIKRLYRKADSPERREVYENYMTRKPCEACVGTGHNRAALAVRLAGLNIAQVNSLKIDELFRWLSDVESEIAESFLAALGSELLLEIRTRIEFMKTVGLDYLSLNRQAPTLSIGEGQRLRLTRQLGCGLTGITYVLDEPSIGLHARDVTKLVALLRQLHEVGNSVIIVEHDPEVIRSADYIVELGPGAGAAGGRLVAIGTPDSIIETPTSATGKMLVGALTVENSRAAPRRPAGEWLTIEGARLNNLDNITVSIPRGCLTCVTGVSGSGKTSLVSGTIAPVVNAALNGRVARNVPHDGVSGCDDYSRVIIVDQQSVARSSRSTTATYVEIFDEIRKVFARVPLSKELGYSTTQFSFNTGKGGRCTKCDGTGSIRVQMHFLSDASILCPKCHGLRFKPATLSVRYAGLNIAEVLELEVSAALDHFAQHPVIVRSLQMLTDVGLGYLLLGQETSTLSGGEAQRLKLARELTRYREESTLYVIDEPTTGLHVHDIQLLVDSLQQLVDRGHTVIVVEHDIDFIATADWVVDLGPGGGDEGGRIVAAGTPEQVSLESDSALRPYLKKHFHEAALKA